jgi:SAM-dependent methyltransferase
VDIDYYAQYFAFEQNDWWFEARRRIVLELIARHEKGPNGQRDVLDAGCGTGITLRYIERFGQVFGVDNQMVALKFCRSRDAKWLTCAPIEELPFADSSFDIVTCLDVIEHIEDDRRAVAEIVRVIRPGGLLVLTVPAFEVFWSDHDVINHHRRRYRRPQIVQLLGSGMKIDLLSYYNTHLFPLAVFVRLLKRIEMKLWPSATRKVTAENTYLPRSINGLFSRIFGSEIFWLKRGALPIGLSIICVAHKVDGSGGLAR